MSSYRPRRSVLYMPGSNPRVLEKGKTLAADCLIFDLEDAVAIDAKAQARKLVCQAVRDGGYGSREIVIRINQLDSEFWEKDLEAAAAAGPEAILVPKVETVADVATVRERLVAAKARPDLVLWVMMESPLAVLYAKEIAAEAAADAYPLEAFVMGTNDLAKATHAELGGDRMAMLAWLSTCVAAARAYDLDIIDGVFNEFRNVAGLVAECRQGLALGMGGKTLIHPSQIEPCNAVFSPREEEVVWARKVIAALEAPENRAKGAISVEGTMVEQLHADMARRTIAISDAIDEMVTEN